MAYDVARGMLEVRLRTRATAAEVDGDRIRAVRVLDMNTGREETIEAAYVLDATELGDLIEMAGVEYVSGAESQAQTGELHASAEADAEKYRRSHGVLQWATIPMANTLLIGRMPTVVGETTILV